MEVLHYYSLIEEQPKVNCPNSLTSSPDERLHLLAFLPIKAHKLCLQLLPLDMGQDGQLSPPYFYAPSSYGKRLNYVHASRWSIEP